MIVLISPSKTFSNEITNGSGDPLFSDKTNNLMSQLKTLSLEQIKNIFKTSDKLSIEVFNYYQNINDKSAAINLYEGVLYKALKDNELTFKNNKLYIVSALYGILRPFDNISKYRLDFTINSFGNLYNYWKDDISNYLSTNYENDIIINLMSKEFEPLIKPLNNVVNIEFKGKDKRLSSVLLKQLRGHMANIIFNDNIESIDDFKLIKINEFKYNDELSNNKSIYFTNY